MRLLSLMAGVCVVLTETAHLNHSRRSHPIQESLPRVRLPVDEEFDMLKRSGFSENLMEKFLKGRYCPLQPNQDLKELMKYFMEELRLRYGGKVMTNQVKVADKYLNRSDFDGNQRTRADRFWAIMKAIFFVEEHLGSDKLKKTMARRIFESFECKSDGKNSSKTAIEALLSGAENLKIYGLGPDNSEMIFYWMIGHVSKSHYDHIREILDPSNTKPPQNELKSNEKPESYHKPHN